MPENLALSGLCSGIIEAYDLFGVPTAIVVFVVEEVSYNICDQRFHEFEISDKRPDIQVSIGVLVGERLPCNEDAMVRTWHAPMCLFFSYVHMWV